VVGAIPVQCENKMLFTCCFAMMQAHIQPAADEKKGSFHSLFPCCAVLVLAKASTTGFDLDQRFSRLRRQWLAFARHVRRRHDQGCGCLGCTQFFRIGAGQGQTG